jgi:hypothetical protein
MWPHGALVSTLAFQAGKTGSTPVGAATEIFRVPIQFVD